MFQNNYIARGGKIKEVDANMQLESGLKIINEHPINEYCDFPI